MFLKRKKMQNISFVPSTRVKFVDFFDVCGLPLFKQFLGAPVSAYRDGSIINDVRI